jgi:hypothetical protein
VSDTRLNSWFWILLVGFAAMAAALAGRNVWEVNQLHAGFRPRGQSSTVYAGQPSSADLAMALQTITAAAPGPSGEFWRDAVADYSPAKEAKRPAAVVGAKIKHGSSAGQVTLH